ncbi:MAG: hypothetical protein ACPIA7_02110 [Akkermansiaceae bacterium]
MLVDTTSSRLLIGEQKKMDWVDDIYKRMTISKRSTGPFGMSQDPNATVIKPREKKVEKGAFLEAVGAIVINTVIPFDRTFISNSREFSVGDQFPIIKNQRQFDVEVVSVSLRGIIFENTATGERVRKKLNTLPSGMKKSSSLGAIPGVYAANKKNVRPLNLDDESLGRINK